MIKYFFIISGFISLAIGLLGLITPGIPTTPLILLTTYLFAKGSPRLHKRLVTNKFINLYLQRLNRGLSIRELFFSISLMWCMISFTAFFVFDYGIMRFLMLGLGIIGTIAQLIVLRGKKKRIEVLKLNEINDK